MDNPSPSRHDFWPTCTVPGCAHRRSHRDGNALFEAIREHTHAWITDIGRAICTCHDDPLPVDGPRERFACDVALAATGGAR